MKNKTEMEKKKHRQKLNATEGNYNKQRTWKKQNQIYYNGEKQDTTEGKQHRTSNLDRAQSEVKHRGQEMGLGGKGGGGSKPLPKLPQLSVSARR